ncbi:hypothetical protein K32_20600 [Kaistia sp. 32K]|uniref:bestrophin-like domain n=1 Tax=Kaistia sp. 32K TaxID=2795690 RepID=UPI001915D85B|nr:hypothetical protein [Kaistia sp. 32K]BCP53443.1 hypothetical protein K32_20600 [Kaistia sp. 32K]
MNVLIAIAEVSFVLFGLVLLAAQLLVHEIGYRIGLRRHVSGGQPETVGVVVGGLLGLLAFVLALTLSYANTRFSERRAGTLVEANAIGTAWLRAKAIGTPRGEEIAHLLETYTGLRKAFILAEGGGGGNIDNLNDSTNAMQSEIWGHLTGLVREQPGPISASLMAALNDVFDAAMSERLAFETRLPAQIFWLLIALTMVSMACLGYQLGLRERPARFLMALLSLMWTVVIVDILDLSAARLGSFRTSVAVYDWTARGFQGGITVPPLPAGP